VISPVARVCCACVCVALVMPVFVVRYVFCAYVCSRAPFLSCLCCALYLSCAVFAVPFLLPRAVLVVPVC